MQVESEIFLPTKLNYDRQKPYQHRHHHASKFSLFLYQLFEQTPVYAYILFFIFTFATYVGTLTTYDEHRTASVPVLFYIELSIFVCCLIEFILRIYASNAKERYRGMQGKRRFFLEHYLIFDFLLLVCYGIVFLWNFTKFYHSHALFLHALRFLQLFRFIPLDRYIGSIPLIYKIVRQYRRVLLATIYICFLLMLPTAYLLWIVERSIKTNDLYFFRTYTDSLWFTINSMATVNMNSNLIITCFFSYTQIGYGDTWPQTLIGDVYFPSISLILCLIYL